MLYPPGVFWERDLIFRTQGERGEAIWVVTALDRERHEVEYHCVGGARYVTKVSVQCRGHAGPQTEVRVTYTFVGLSEAGNRDIEAMSEHSYDEKMRQWQEWISAHLSGRTS